MGITTAYTHTQTPKQQNTWAPQCVWVVHIHKCGKCTHDSQYDEDLNEKLRIPSMTASSPYSISFHSLMHMRVVVEPLCSRWMSFVPVYAERTQHKINMASFSTHNTQRVHNIPEIAIEWEFFLLYIMQLRTTTHCSPPLCYTFIQHNTHNKSIGIESSSVSAWYFASINSWTLWLRQHFMLPFDCSWYFIVFIRQKNG